MKLYAVIFCLVISVSALGQGSGDTSAKTKPLNSVATKDTLYVIDGEPSQNKLNNIDPKDIFSITVLKNDNKDPSMNPSNKVVAIVITKQSAVKMYKKKFSALSKEYKAYLENAKPEDQNILYVLNGAPISDYSTNGVKTLYDIPFKKIRKVTFLKGVDTPEIYDSRPVPILVIKTKK
jgi:hypothetical protein